MESWYLISGEYPPQHGGVADYSRLVACGLAELGDSVRVFAPGSQGLRPRDSGVEVNLLPGNFGVRGLKAMNDALLDHPPDRILVQYVPHAFGWKAMNLLFCAWLFSTSRRHHISVMFHEVAFPWGAGQSLRHNFLGAVNRVMALLVSRSADRILVSTPSWEKMLRKYARPDQQIIWLPVPSNIPVIEDPCAVREVRARYQSEEGLLLGHFGTYGPLVSEALKVSLQILLGTNATLKCLLLGAGSEPFRAHLADQSPHLNSRMFASGSLPASGISHHIAACDLMLQPYPDGISSRRTTAMAVLAHGRPLVSNAGHLTESVWHHGHGLMLASNSDPGVIAEQAKLLLTDDYRRASLGVAGKRLYERCFSLPRTIGELRNCPQ